VNGHAIAGGLRDDVRGRNYRLMSGGKGTIGVPELKVGVPFPLVAIENPALRGDERANLQETGVRREDL